MVTEVWVKSIDGPYIRASSITALDVVDGNYRHVSEHEPTSNVYVRALVGLQDGESNWHDLAEKLRGGQAHAALRQLIFALGHHTATGVLSFDPTALDWSFRSS